MRYIFIGGDDVDSKALRNGVLSFIVPGVGQFLEGESQKAVMLFAGVIALHFIIYFLFNNAFGSLISTLYHLYAGYDAYRLTENR